MDSLNTHIQEYQLQLSKGHIQIAYKGIMTFMSSLKSHLEKTYPNYVTSSLYYGYLDMSYFAFSPPGLKIKKLKIAIVYLHEFGRFEAWLSGNNRKIQAAYIARLSQKNFDEFTLSQVGPGVDSIIEIILVEKPNFDRREDLISQIEWKAIGFINDMTALLNEKA